MERVDTQEATQARHSRQTCIKYTRTLPYFLAAAAGIKYTTQTSDK
jgi:hypothetical protein